MTDVYKSIQTVCPGRYDMAMDEARQIIDHCSGDKFGIASDAFRFGFLKGQRAAAKKQEPLDTEAACERHIITTWLDIHKDDTRLLRLLRIRAFALDGIYTRIRRAQQKLYQEGTT